MRIVVDINHPAQVHFFKHSIWRLKEQGHEVLVTASEKDLTRYLLDKYNFNYCILGDYGHSLVKKILNVPLMDIRMYNIIKNFRPDIFLGFGSIRAAHVAKLMRKPSIIFDDDEYSYPYYHFFADVICGFSGFKKSGPKVIKIDGLKELAYLHPNVFQSNPEVLEKHGVSLKEKYAVLRFVSWNAFHDVGRKGLDDESKKKLIKKISEHCRVFITSESPLSEEFEQYRLTVPPEFIHDLLQNATLLVCDSQTMTTEAAVLGTPAVRCNSFVGANDMGNFIELEYKYKLIYNCKNIELALSRVEELLHTTNLKNEWAQRRDLLVSEKIDVTAFMMWFVENYPDSLFEMHEHPNLQ